MSGSSRWHYPFTESQWEELETQALVYKYMVSGLQVPPHLILHVRRSLSLSASSSSSSSFVPPFGPPQLHPQHQHFYELGYGRSKVGGDTEPGRCRRTDGKKWRCSNEAYPDSKYCEKHMHRGKHRSRKHVEPQRTSTTTAAAAAATNVGSGPQVLTAPTSSISPPLHTFVSTNTSTSTRLAGSVPAFHNPYEASSHPRYHYNFQTSSHANKLHSYRYIVHGKPSEADQESFLGEASGGQIDSPSPPHDQYQRVLTECSPQPQDRHQLLDHQCLVPGSELASHGHVQSEREDRSQKPIHHFFGK